MMKNITLVLALIFAITNSSFGQTTQEEYNYLTKGYKVQIESGLDMKKGYSITDYGNWGLTHGNQNRQCTFRGLIRQGQTKPCAILMIYKRTDIADGVTRYVCIPSPNTSSEIWQQTLDELNTNFIGQSDMCETTIWALMKFSSEFATK